MARRRTRTASSCSRSSCRPAALQGAGGRRSSRPGDGARQRRNRSQVPAVSARRASLPVLREFDRPEPDGRLRRLARHQTGGAEPQAPAGDEPGGLLRRLARRRSRAPDVPARHDADGAAVRSCPNGAERRARSLSRKASIRSRIVSYGLFSVSDTGTLVYRGGAESRFALMWFDQRAAIPVSRWVIRATMRIRPCRRMAPASPSRSARRLSGYLDLDVARGERRRASRSIQPTTTTPCGRQTAGTSRFLRTAAGRRSCTSSPPTDPAKNACSPISRASRRAGRKTVASCSSRAGLRNTGGHLGLAGSGQASAKSKPYPVLATPFNEAQAAGFSGRPLGRLHVERILCCRRLRPAVLARRKYAARAGAKWLVSKGLVSFPRGARTAEQLFYMTASAASR